MGKPLRGFEKVMYLAKQLSLLDKVRLIENLFHDVESSIRDQTTQKRRSLRGLFKGCSISANEIDQARRAMWGHFPGEDFDA